MGEYEPRDSRIVTQNPSTTPIEPERTGPKEDATRAGAGNAPRQVEPAEGQREEVSEEDRWQVGEADRKEGAGT